QGFFFSPERRYRLTQSLCARVTADLELVWDRIFQHVDGIGLRPSHAPPPAISLPKGPKRSQFGIPPYCFHLGFQSFLGDNDSSSCKQLIVNDGLHSSNGLRSSTARCTDGGQAENLGLSVVD